MRVPISLEDLKRKKDEEESKASRPVFISKATRRETSRKEKKRKLEEYHQRPARNTTKRFRAEQTGEMPEHDTSKGATERIRNVYKRNTGTKYVTSSRGRHSSKFRFGWDESDDTAADDEFRHVGVPTPQFGRGRLGGMSGMFDVKGAIHSHLRDSRHWSEKPRDQMSDRDWRIFREDFLISTRSSSMPAPNPARSWDETGLPLRILDLIKRVARYHQPSPIQMAAIPVGLEKRDCIGLAETGSGKTAAFVLPMIVHLMNMPKMTAAIAGNGPYALVVAPTRELALQIVTEAKKFTEPMGFRVIAIIGGQEMDVQAMSLQAGCEVVVCTPGRMVDLLSRQMAALGNCNYLILDEADRMIDMGFEPQLADVLDCMPSEGRRTFMFSATMSRAVERLARSYLKDPVVISVGETGKAADNVIQRVEYFSSEARRRKRFIELLETLEAPILVFSNTRSGCEMIARNVESNSVVRPVIMHSGKSQEQREKTLEGFRTGRFNVLIATDVVGRGIDIKGVKHVINFELPKTIETYTHRIGRTGRASEKGTAWSLATDVDKLLFASLASLLQKSGASIPSEILREAKGSRGSRAITD
ncbi:DEAD-box ATP-dependent RNA helicase 21 [Gracilariopsis chorda]|uniref:RNA helicase n=1 Tax=Gracilariopsis chorda TaxID=448386 RepID=A0A2V3IP44_9FLOR|nr:DEAD-box ATP-dependent RNA helicase 21 [Gracilariopsis chorda]|eukprot:PXF43842.1 DEAD-box ATP-dependent RNA helicase 21 [Gracilariopsis chorda]